MHTRVKYLRIRAGLTQEELAKNASVSRSTIQSTESGNFPRVTSLREIAKALNCDITELYTENLQYADGFFDPSKPDGPSNVAA